MAIRCSRDDAEGASQPMPARTSGGKATNAAKTLLRYCPFSRRAQRQRATLQGLAEATL